MRCVKCNGTGVCQPCKGSGRSGFFLVSPKNFAPLCRWCKGTKKCSDCKGTGDIPERKFRPYIRVLHSERVPQPIFAAVLTRAPWRWLQIPDEVLRRNLQAQLSYVRWRCRTHFRDTAGRCYLFGSITGFEWVKSESEIIVLDIHGRVSAVAERASSSGTGTLSIGNKVLAVCGSRRRP